MTIHINRPSSARYVVCARHRGFQKYEVIGKPTRSLKSAMRRLADAISTQGYKRGDVWLTADWYDPTRVAELVRK